MAEADIEAAAAIQIDAFGGVLADSIARYHDGPRFTYRDSWVVETGGEIGAVAIVIPATWWFRGQMYPISAVAGVVLGLSASAKQDDAHKLCPNMATPCAQADRANALLSTGRSRAVEANVAFGIGAAAAIGAGVLWFTGGSEAEHARHVSVVPHVAHGESGIAILGRF